MFEISHYSVCHGSYHRLYLNDKWSQPGHALFFFLVVVVLVHLQWDGDKVGITQPKAPEVGAGMGREEWRRGKVFTGKPHQSLRATALSREVLAQLWLSWQKNEVNLKKQPKAPGRGRVVFAMQSNWLVPCLDYAKFGSSPIKRLQAGNSPCCSLTDGFLLCLPGHRKCWCGHLRIKKTRKHLKNQIKNPFSKYSSVCMYISTHI